MEGSFLHCFSRHCGVPLWVECDGILDTSPLVLKSREVLGAGITTIGINMRTTNDVPQNVVEHANIKTYRDRTSDNCILDTTAITENLVSAPQIIYEKDN